MPSPYDDLPSAYHDSAFRNRVFGITGSAHGIGESTIRQLAKFGARVIVMDIDAENLRRVEADLKAMNADALCLIGNVANDRFLRKAIGNAYKRWGRIDGWVNNAMMNPGHQPEDLPIEDLEETWRVNIRAAWQSTALLTPIMREAGGGTIVNISSILAHQPYTHTAAYAATKAGIEGLTRSLAVDLAPDRIRVNTIIPGSINTIHDPLRLRHRPADVPDEVINQFLKLRLQFREMMWRHYQPWPEPGQARDAADAILFFLSDASRFVTGASLFVDGGASASTIHPFYKDLEKWARLRKKMRTLIAQYPNLRRRNTLLAQGLNDKPRPKSPKK